MRDVPGRPIEIAVALSVGLTWGALSLVFFSHPDFGQPVLLVDYAAVLLFSAGLALLAPGVRLLASVAGLTMTMSQPATVVVVTAGTIVGALTVADGGLLVAIAAWLVAGLVKGLGPASVVRAAAAIVAVSAPLAGVGNLIEDGIGAKDPGAMIYILGASGTVVGLLGLSLALALGRRLILAALCGSTLVGVYSSTQYGGGLVVMGLWLVFAAWLWRAGARGLERGSYGAS